MNPYDLVPYPSYPIPQSHPARLATMAKLLSLPAPDLETARVLELGCASGGNIVPLALEYPRGRFVGLDLSEVELGAGRQMILALGLENIELRHGDIMNVDASWGEFDYIICHGVFSWVPETVQDKILSLVGGQLTSDGIAFISYNTFPGWHGRNVVRDLMRRHSLRFEEPEKRVAEARRVLREIGEIAQVCGDSPYGALLKDEVKILDDRSDPYVFHEHLNEYCQPFYFADFMRRAREKGLEYVGESSLSEMATAQGGDLKQALASFASDPIEIEQLADFCVNRTYRTTLVRRTGLKPSFDLHASTLWFMHIASGAHPKLAVDLAGAETTTFVDHAGRTIQASLPLFKAALLETATHWPASIPFEHLVNKAAARVGSAVSDVQRTLLARAILTALTQSRAIEVRVEPSHFTVTPGEFPIASPLARELAGSSKIVTNCRHELVELSKEQRRILRALDGTCNGDEVARRTQISKDVVDSQISLLARLALIIR